MYGRSQYLTRDARRIAFVWLLLAASLFGFGGLSFVTAQTPWGLVGSFLAWFFSLVLFGMWVEWWSR